MILKETNKLLEEIRDELRKMNERASQPTPSTEEMMKQMTGSGGIGDMLQTIMKGAQNGS